MFKIFIYKTQVFFPSLMTSALLTNVLNENLWLKEKMSKKHNFWEERKWLSNSDTKCEQDTM